MKSLRLTFLLGAVLWHSTLHAMMNAATAQIGGPAQVVGTCPANCKLIQSINNVATAEDNNGIRVNFEWATATLPAELKMVGFTVSVKLVLKNDKTVESDERNTGPNERSALFIVQGPVTNRNINLSDVKAGSVTVKANAITTNTPTVNVTSKEILGDDGAEVNMRVRWTPPAVSSPCLAERMVNVSGSAENAGGIRFEGGEIVRLSAGTAVIRLRGVGIRRKDMKNLQANLTVTSVALSCALAKPLTAFGSGTGSNQ